MEDKKTEIDKWVSHFQSMAEGINSNEKKQFYILKKNPQINSLASKLTDNAPVISPAESIVNQAVQEVKRQREQSPKEKSQKKKKRIQIISDNLSTI